MMSQLTLPFPVKKRALRNVRRPKVKRWSRDRPPLAEDEVYIGRPSPWGNPFEIGRDGSRAEVIAKYRAWIYAQPELMARARTELRGKTLVCWCSPKPCHGQVLLEIANS